MKPQFLNIDLEITSPDRLVRVEKELKEAGALNLFSGEVEDGYLTTFEVDSDKKTPEQTIEAFQSLIKEWNEASEIIFDIGYESQETVEHPLEKKTERILEGLNAIVRFTTYRPTDAN